MRMEIEVFGEKVTVEGEESQDTLFQIARDIETRAQSLGAGKTPLLRLASALAFSYAYEAHQSRAAAEEKSRALLAESAAHEEAQTRAEWATKGRAENEAKIQDILETAALREETLVNRILELEIRAKARAVAKRTMIARTRKIQRKAA